MNLTEALKTFPLILAEGAVIERLRRKSDHHLDPELENAGLLYHEGGRAAMADMYRGYMDIGSSYGLPMILFTPTWRANPERLRQAGFENHDDVNGEGFRFLDSLRKEQGRYAGRICIGGLLGCRGDAYKPEEALSEDEAAEFHVHQAQALARAGVDFLMAATLPAFSEALGMARAMSASECSYVLSFVIRPTGTLLDGTPLDVAVGQIDAALHPRPAGYMANCIHPSVFKEALTRLTEASRSRMIGLQANTSRKSPEDLDGLPALDSEEPAVFARQMKELHERFDIKVLGGCCGTDGRHIEGIAYTTTLSAR
jgi:homocysteine S-methyltransferase